MNKWITIGSRAGMMGLAWAFAWLPVGIVTARVIVGGELDPEHFGGPLYAGFLCGAVFSALAGIASSRHRLDELSPYRAAAWGAAGGLVVGVLPFVVGDNGRYSNLWATILVAASAAAAGMAAGRRRSDELSIVRAASLAAGAAGLLAGVLPWILTTENLPERFQRFLPVTVIGGMCGMSALSAFVSPLIARWLGTHDSAAPAANR